MTHTLHLSVRSSCEPCKQSIAQSAAADAREAALSAIFELGIAGISEVDLRSGHFVRVNRRFCEMMRRSSDELLRIGPAQVIHPDDVDAVKARWTAGMDGPGHWEDEVRHIGPKNEIIWARIGVSAWKRDENGIPTCCIAILQDVTDSVLALERLRVNEEILRLGEGIASIGSFRRNLITGLASCSPQGREILCMPPGDGTFPAQELFESLLPEDRARVAETLREAIARRDVSVAVACRLQPAGGAPIKHLELRARYDFDGEGQPVGSIGVVIDVTERKTTEERLRSSEMLLRVGQEIGRIGSFSRDLRANVIECSPQAREIFNLPRDDEPVPTQVWLASIIEEDRTRVATEMADAVSRHVTEVSIECRTRRAPGDPVRFVEVRARYSFDENGLPMRSIGVVIDLTERKKVEERLRAGEMFMRMAMQIGQIGPYQHDVGGSGVIDCGPQTRALHGFPPDGGPFHQSAWLATVLPEDAERISYEVNNAYAHQTPEISFHYRFRRPSDGVLRHMEARTRFEYDGKGRPLKSTGVLIDVTDRRIAEHQLAHAASHDALTDLPNRVLFEDRVTEALARARRSEGFALLCMDLDRFKQVNDTLGHHVGDRLLKEAAARLKAELREIDTLARLGGDEFAIIQSTLDQAHDAASLARRLSERLAEPFEFDGQKVTIGVSIGIAIAPDDGSRYDDLLKAADMALYQAKADGRGKWRYFEAEMNELAQTRRALEADLRKALERDEFELFYQPIIDIPSRRVKSLEALIRWRHPTRGLVPPNDFIPLCEETGLILPIGAWVLHKACKDAAGWPHELGVAINLSPAQFASRNLVELIGSALKENNLTARRLEIEITETVMLQDADSTLATLHAIKELGVRIAMDDFGTGYSSLSYLQSFPFDKVKIDRAFTQGLGRSRKSSAIVQAVTDLCAALDMRTTAEGVETEEQFQALIGKGCKEAQGFLFSKPRPAAEIPELLMRMGIYSEWPQAAE